MKKLKISPGYSNADFIQLIAKESIVIIRNFEFEVIRLKKIFLERAYRTKDKDFIYKDFLLFKKKVSKLINDYFMQFEISTSLAKSLVEKITKSNILGILEAKNEFEKN